MGTSVGIITPPIVDPTNGTTFVVDANSGAGGSAVLAEFDTASLLPMSIVNIGIGATTGTKVRLLQPAVTNDYYTSSFDWSNRCVRNWGCRYETVGVFLRVHRELYARRSLQSHSNYLRISQPVARD